MTASVAWGVTSRGVRPVPPVVTTSGWRAAAALSAPSIAGRSSGDDFALDAEAERLEPLRDGRPPDVSSRSPAAPRSLAVSTQRRSAAHGVALAVLPLVIRPATRSPGFVVRAAVGLGRRAVGASRRSCRRSSRRSRTARISTPSLDALDHVVDRQRGDRRRGQRLHLDAGLVRSSRPRRGRGARRRRDPA